MIPSPATKPLDSFKTSLGLLCPNVKAEGSGDVMAPRAGFWHISTCLVEEVLISAAFDLGFCKCLRIGVSQFIQ